MKKIGIDARMLGKGHGLGRYVEQLLRGIGQYGGEHQYVVFVLNAECKMQNVELLSKFEIVETNVVWYSMEEQVKFSSIIKKQNIDLMHFPHWNIPLLYNDPYIVTIHDLTMYHYPRLEATTHGPVLYWVKDMAHRLVVKHAVERAKHIITTSEFTKQDIRQALGVPLEKMTTVYQGVGISDQKSGNSGIDIKSRFGITKPYVLYVGAAYPHKNMDGLLSAWELFCEKYGDGYQLVLAGKDSVFYQKLLEQYDHLISRSSVVFTNFVTDEELAVLYKNARTFVFPSLYEGFGIPPLEAIQYSVPVVASNASCLPEVLGEGAYYVDPKSSEAIVDGLYLVCTNEDVRYVLKQQGREELKRYSSESFAKQTISLYTKKSQT
jgi:glycosyltransferase involved in cell wall biosynthesis